MKRIPSARLGKGVGEGFPGLGVEGNGGMDLCFSLPQANSMSSKAHAVYFLPLLCIHSIFKD